MMSLNEIIEKETATLKTTISYTKDAPQFKVGDLVKATGKRVSLTCPSNDVGIIVETMSDKAYVRTGRTVRVYWQRNKRKAIVNPNWLEKINI